MPSDLSKIFEQTLRFLNFFGVWAGKTPSKYYKYFSFISVFLAVVCYNLLLTINLVYTPRNIELILREVIFFFTEITVTAKVFTVILMRDEIIEVLNFIDNDKFIGDNGKKDGILYKTHKGYKFSWRVYNILAHAAYIFDIIAPLFLAFLRGTKSELPVCKYYFLDDEFRDSYFFILFLYQAIGMYGHMIYNVNVDTLSAGFLAIAVAQLKLLNSNLTTLKLSAEECKLPREIQEKIQITRLNKLLRHYEFILNYCGAVQNVLSISLFIQFGVGSLIICVVMCSLLMPASMESRLFMVIYLLMMTGQIFVPGYLGTLLTYESQELVTAAYNCEWLVRSKSFRKDLILFRERAARPIRISGMKMFPLSLVTFIAIMKTAYSFFTLIRNVQDK
ncbi:odorant receptor 7a [Helicoverpa armigera]|uniref:odorant receptor 7a n=1 Tax=Helicoverpa armigera TaxID=29058 RepID=UPI003082D2DF